MAISILLLLVSILFLLTGFGITQYQLVEKLTFGLLGKALSYKIHEILWAPFILLLLMHILTGLWNIKKVA
jgi:hypothetical protein